MTNSPPEKVKILSSYQEISPDHSPSYYGHMVHIDNLSGCQIGLFDFTLTEDVHVNSQKFPKLQICIMLEGQGLSLLGKTQTPIAFTPGYISLYYNPNPIESSFMASKNSHITFIDLTFDPDKMDLAFLPPLLSNITQSNFKAYATGCHDFWLHYLPTPIAIQQTAQEIMAKIEHFKGEKSSQTLALEAKSLDILSQILALIEKPGNCELLYAHKLSQRDRQNIQDAYQLMMSNLAHDWSIKELAEAVGLNQTKLKRGFRDLIGMPVHHCLQHHRMASAAKALLADNHKIIDISLSVGYANPAHFAKIFKRQFGLSPRDYRYHAQRQPGTP